MSEGRSMNQVGNVRVTGDIITPPEITHAVAVWCAYEWNARKANCGDTAAPSIVPAGRLARPV